MIRTEIAGFAALLSIMVCTVVWAKGLAPSIRQIDSETVTSKWPDSKSPHPDVYFGEKIIFEDWHSGDVVARVGIWEADVSTTRLELYPFTEYVLMLSGRLVITNDDGSSMEYEAGDTFVMPKGWTGIWDIKERMRKQMVQIGDPKAPVTAIPLVGDAGDFTL